MTPDLQADARSELPDIVIRSLAACEVAKGYRLVGAPVEGDLVLLVLQGTMHLRLPTGRAVARRGSMVMVPAGQAPAIAPAAGGAKDIIATRKSLVRRGRLSIFDIAGGGTGHLRVLVAGVCGNVWPMLRRSRTEPPIVSSANGLLLARHLCEALMEEIDNPRGNDLRFIRSLMNSWIFLFLRSLEDDGQVETDRRSPSHRQISRVLARIDDHPATPHSIETLRVEARMSRATFLRQFMKQVGTSPMDYVTSVRLQHAARLLKDEAGSIKEVAAASGFLSRTHFTRVFQAMFGTSPTGFREAHQGFDGSDKGEGAKAGPISRV